MHLFILIYLNVNVVISVNIEPRAIAAVLSSTNYRNMAATAIRFHLTPTFIFKNKKTLIYQKCSTRD